MNHRALVAEIKQRIKARKLWYLCAADSRRIDSPGGWPDFIVIGVGGVLEREVKTDGDVLRPLQRWIGARLVSAGHNWSTWTAADLASGRVDRELDALTARRPV